jgi:hypothetical protein
MNLKKIARTHPAIILITVLLVSPQWVPQAPAQAPPAEELAELNNLRFGTCVIDPPFIADSAQVYLHQTQCPLGLSGSATVIAFPGGAAGRPVTDCSVDTPSQGVRAYCLHRRLVPKGSYAHCTPACHLDVVIANTAPAGGGINDGPKIWIWIAWN